MWFADRTPAVPAPTNLYRINLRNPAGCAKDSVEIEAHGYGTLTGLNDGWFLFLKDGVVVYRVAAREVRSIELVEPDLFVFEFLFDPASKSESDDYRGAGPLNAANASG